MHGTNVKINAQLFGSQLKQWNLFEEGVMVSLYRKRQTHIATHDSVDGDMVY